MASVGETLRQERLRQGLSLDEVASRIRINARFLEALEQEEYDKLPGRFFARSFLRQYAALLGLGEDAVADALAGLEVPAEPEPVATPPTAPAIGVAPIDIHPAARREALKRWVGSVAALLLVVVICAGVYALWKQFHAAPPPAAEPAARQPSPPFQAAQPPAPPAEALPAAAPPAPAAPAAPIALEVRATQETWIRVLSDGKAAFAGTLSPGQSRSFAARESMNLLTGNAGGMEAVFNGKPLGPLGPPGQIRVLELTPSEYRLLERKPPPEP